MDGVLVKLMIVEPVRYRSNRGFNKKNCLDAFRNVQTLFKTLRTVLKLSGCF